MSLSRLRNCWIVALTGVAMTSVVLAKNGKELPILGPRGPRIMYVPKQNKLLMWNVSAPKPIGNLPGIAVVNGADGKILGVIRGTFAGFSPDGASIVTLSETVGLWHTATAKPRKELPVLLSPSAVAFSPDSKMLAVVGKVNDFGRPLTLKVFELPSGKERWSMPLPNLVSLMAGPSGQLVVVQTPTMWTLLDFQSGETLKQFVAARSDQTVISGDIHFNKDASRFIAADGTNVAIWDVEGRKKLLTVKESAPFVSKFVPNDDRHSGVLVIGTSLGIMKSFNLDDLTMIEFGDRHQSGIVAIDINQSRRIAVTASQDFRIKVWDISTGQLMETFMEEKDEVATVSISTDGLRVASCCFREGSPVRIWNLK